MRVVSVNVGSRDTVSIGDRRVETGIDKRPVTRAVVNSLGLTDDAIVDTEHHGGADQAVYVYSAADYDWWATELDRTDLRPGLFGENLTLDLGAVGVLRVGDRLVVGRSVVLEVTAPRIPCAVFQNAVDEPGWVKRFNDARRHGAYCRVVTGGVVSEGDPVRIDPADPSFPDVEDVADIALDRVKDPDRLRAALAAPIASRSREYIERRLARRDG
jgi:MOSC domain-containing protein YiiM